MYRNEKEKEKRHAWASSWRRSGQANRVNNALVIQSPETNATFASLGRLTKASSGRIIVAAVVSYLAFGLITAVTEQILSSLGTSGSTTRPSYFVADVVTQCLYLIAAGYLCSVIAGSFHRPAIFFLIALGLLVGTLSFVTSWKSEPHWYGIALLLTYAPCIWTGWALRAGHLQ